MPELTVTISGADDGVNPFHLLALSEEFPFVEWGILFSAKRCGTPRYPSMPWLMGLERAAFAGQMRLALHLCGQAARQTMEGNDRWAFLVGRDEHQEPRFKRAQLNGYEHGSLNTDWLAEAGVEWILQARTRQQVGQAAEDAAAMGNASILFDPSGGRGLGVSVDSAWPAAPPGVKLGHAGGIGPDDVEHRYREAVRLGASWIDMESGVRGNTVDFFDLDRVRRVLEACDAVGKELER